MVPVTVSHILECQHLFHYPTVFDVCLHTYSVAPSQPDLSSEPTQGRIPSAWPGPGLTDYLLHVALATHIPAGTVEKHHEGRSQSAGRGPLVTKEPQRIVSGLQLLLFRWQHRTCPRWRSLGKGRSHHRGEPGHRSHLVVLGPGLQILQREER